MPKPVGIGLIGAGMVGQIAHLANFIDVPGCTVVALAELRPELGAAVARRFGVQRVYPTHRALLQDPDVDAVVVVTRRPATGPVVLDALRAGKHVLSEKPMAHTVEQAARLVEAAEAAGVRYAVGFMKRHDPGTAAARQAMESFAASGELGSIVSVRAFGFGGDVSNDGTGFVMTDETRPDGLDTWPFAPPWLDPAHHAAYAEFLNVHTHLLNILRFLVPGRPTVRAADLRSPAGGSMILEYPGHGAVVETGARSRGPWDEGLEIRYQSGGISVRFPPPFRRGATAAVTVRYDGSVARRVELAVPAGWAFRRQAESFVEDIRVGREPLSSGRDGMEDLLIAEKAWQLQAAGALAR